MCRSAEDGGRRCNHQSVVGKQVRALQAKKQYNAKYHPDKVAEITRQLHHLQALNKLWQEHAKPFKMEITPATEKIIDGLEEAGFQPYIVGGSVRDQILGLNSKDIDIEVYGGTSDDIAKTLRKLGKVDEVGKSFGVLKIVLDGEDFDVSLPRTESKAGEGHKGFDVQVDHNLTPEEASSRRDFTINALMYSPSHNVVIDYHGGLEDVEQKTLRPVSDAFKDDPLRVLRGIQMSSRFGYGLHEETINVSKELSPEFSTLSVERVQVEFQKLYSKGKDVSAGFKALKQTTWDTHFPGLAEVNNEQLWNELDSAQKKITNGEYRNRELLFGSVVASHISDEQQRKVFLTYTNVGDNVKNQVLFLTDDSGPVEQTPGAVRTWVRDLKRNLTAEDWVVLQEAKGNHEQARKIERIAKEANVWREVEKDWVTGNEIMDIYGQKPGPWVREVMDKAREVQYNREVSDKQSLLNIIKTWVN